MGQNISQPRRPDQEQSALQSVRPDRRRRRHSVATLLSNLQHIGHSNTSDDAVLLPNSEAAESADSLRSSSRNRLSRLLRMSSNANTEPPLQAHAPLQRSRSTFTSIFRREPSHSQSEWPSASRSLGLYRHRTSYLRTAGSDAEQSQSLNAPRLPSIDQSSTFDRDMFTWSDRADSPSRTAHSHRRPNIRFNALRPDRPFRHLTSSLRRRRTPPPVNPRRVVSTEDQAVLLSQLLSAAAAATAATLMGDDHQALNEARSLSLGNSFGDMAGSGEDGSFAGFLSALSSGRFASALRQNGEDVEETTGMQTNPLNFFRMFRFGSLSNPASSNRTETNHSVDANNAQTDGSAATTTTNNNNNSPPNESRMVPIIIVGIRSISPSSNSGSGPSDELPPFLDALSNFNSPTRESDELDPLAPGSIDSILHPPQNGTSFRHRRRASMGGLGFGRHRMHDRHDDNREQRSERRRERPWSMASSASNEPRPPPATPASPSPELSRIPSTNTTPAQSRPTSMVANSIRELTGETSRNSLLRRSLSSPLASHTEESRSLHSVPSQDALIQHTADSAPTPTWARRSEASPNVHYPRFASGHPRRNGVVEPDNLPPLSRQSTNAGNAEAGSDGANVRNGDSRSWIIYVLGGSYPENHPILTTPSLFSDNPTYEDMMLLSALLGPAKAPVATDEDIQNAGGVYVVKVAEEPIATQDHGSGTPALSGLVATASEDTNIEVNPARVALEANHRCLVCLCDFEAEETLRRLGKCGHLFHKECIDHWLTQGRNSCPLCRGEGVEEKSAHPDAADSTPAAQDSPAQPITA